MWLRAEQIVGSSGEPAVETREVNLPRKPIVFFRQWSSLQTLFSCAVTYFACVRKIYLTTLVSYGSAP